MTAGLLHMLSKVSVRYNLYFAGFLTSARRRADDNFIFFNWYCHIFDLYSKMALFILHFISFFFGGGGSQSGLLSWHGRKKWHTFFMVYMVKDKKSLSGIFALLRMTHTCESKGLVPWPTPGPTAMSCVSGTKILCYQDLQIIYQALLHPWKPHGTQ